MDNEEELIQYIKEHIIGGVDNINQPLDLSYLMIKHINDFKSLPLNYTRISIEDSIKDELLFCKNEMYQLVIFSHEGREITRAILAIVNKLINNGFLNGRLWLKLKEDSILIPVPASKVTHSELVHFSTDNTLQIPCGTDNGYISLGIPHKDIESIYFAGFTTALSLKRNMISINKAMKNMKIAFSEDDL